MAYSYSVKALETAHISFRDLLNAQSPAKPSIRIYDIGNVLLGSILLADPSCGVVSAVTGQCVFTIDTQEDAALATGEADHGEICDGNGDAHLTLDCQAGSSPVSGALVLGTLSIVIGTPIDIVSATIG